MRWSLGLALLTSLAFFMGVSLASQEQGALYQFELTGLNRKYPQPVGELPPISLEPLLLRWRSPDAIVEVLSHRVRLWERSNGSYDGEVEIEFAGQGTLVIDLDGPGLSQRLTDAVVLPRQRLRVPGRVALEKVPQGYRVRAEGIPSRLQIALRSQLVTRVLDLCRSVEFLALGAIDCTSLEGGLTRPVLTLPSEIETTLVEADLLPSDRGVLDRLIAAGSRFRAGDSMRTHP